MHCDSAKHTAEAAATDFHKQTLPDVAFLRPPDVLDTVQWNAIAHRLGLSGRERDILRLAMYDESVGAIARGLGLSEHTVRTYRDRLFRKLRTHSVCQVVCVVFATHLTLTRAISHDSSVEREAASDIRP
jgi:DNA-binding CsgD family transcriptional regulator